MPGSQVVQLTQELVRFNTVNPPGNEAGVALFVAKVLEEAGFTVALHALAENRLSLVADAPGTDGRPPLCFSGHLDTVGLGTEPWSVDPLAGEVSGGRIYGRGTTDMKGGIAAFIVAALETRKARRAGIKIVLTAGEETGCDGARHLLRLRAFGEARAVLVAEPTSNAPCLGHRGVLWLRMKMKGRAAHGSTPERGDNAVIKAARAITAIGDFRFDVAPHDHLGLPSLSIGYCRGGQNINVVPDMSEIGIDIRTTPGVDCDRVRADLIARSQASHTDTLLELRPVMTDPDNAWFACVTKITARVTGENAAPGAAPYFTDASILMQGFNDPPLAILGPGDLGQAHCVDECCEIRRIEEAQQVYAQLMLYS